jgi:hypothetical protein
MAGAMLLTIINLIVLGLNIAILGISIKLYTEYFKDKKIESRIDQGG